MKQQDSLVKSEESFFKRVLLFFRPFWAYFTIITLMVLVIQVVATFSPYLFGKAVDSVLAHDAKNTIFFFAISAIIFFLQSEVLSYIREKIEVNHLDHHIERSFSVRSIGKMFGFSIGQHTNEHSGVKQTVVNKGQSALTNVMYTILYTILPNVLQIIATLAILTFFDWRIALIAFTFVILYVYVSQGRNRKFLPFIEQIRKNNQEQSKLASELYRNATLVISEAQEKLTLDAFDKKYENITKHTTKTWSRYLDSHYLHKILIFLGRYLSLGLGIYLIFIGQHSTGMLVTFFSWVGNIFGNLVQIMNIQRHFIFQMVEIKKFFDLMDIKPDIDTSAGGTIIEPFNGSIEFRNVSFAYPYRQSAKEIENEEVSNKKEDRAIQDVNFVIPAGAKIGFVGVSGSGKSTIVNLMRRFYDVTGGEILIDGINIKEIDIKWLRSRIGNVEQKIDLFDRSIKDNIIFGLSEDKLNIIDEYLTQVVKDASLDDFVAKLKDHGLDTVIGEGGIKVSGGERQRIGIARALIKDPKILIFDEATSALDSINEKLIHDAINRSAQGRTTIMIAHRLSTVMDADIIFVVAEGKIVDRGTHDELKKRCKEYQELIKNQIF